MYSSILQKDMLFTNLYQKKTHLLCYFKDDRLFEINIFKIVIFPHV